MAKTKKQEVAIEELPVVEGQVIENVAQKNQKTRGCYRRITSCRRTGN